MKIKTRRTSGITIIGAIVVIIVAVAAGYCFYKLVCRIAERVKEIGDRRAAQITNELSESSIALPWTVNDEGEYVYVIPDEQVDQFFDGLRDVTIQSSPDLTNWYYRTCMRTHPDLWAELAKPIMDWDRGNTNTRMQFYRGAW